MGRGPIALHRAEAALQEADRAVATRGDRPRALHPLLPLRALLPGGGRGLPAGVPGARRPHLRGHARRAPVRGAVQREHRGALSRRRTHEHGLPLQGAAVGHRGLGVGLHALPEPVQRRADGARRQEGPPGAGTRQRRGRRRLAVRQGPLRLPGVPRGRARTRADDPRGGRPSAGVVGASDGGGGQRPGSGGRGHRGDRRRGGHQRGGLPAPVPDAGGPRVPPPRLPDRRTDRRRNGEVARSAGPHGRGLRHRSRRGRAGARDGARRRGSHPRPPGAQGRSPKRCPAGRGHQPAELARSECGRGGPLRARLRGGADRRADRGARRRRG